MQRLGAGGASFVNLYEAQLGMTCCAIASFPLSLGLLRCGKPRVFRPGRNTR
ncbi:hypothetical protein [Coleofasciculus sp.]|uniref:hypothetical protein n=1 Tax=Coleofasciculus sp. TaxID=3100458 RepID=UPI0039F7AFFB